jgi:hypothetical protein
MTSTMVAPQTTADGHSTRQPFPEVPCLLPGSAAPTPHTPPATAGGAPEATASLASDGCYRWTLTRRWGPGRAMTWIMLNPSRAGAASDDPTLRRVIGFARAAGCGQITVTNLYAWRSPSPSTLRRVADPVGAANDQAILDATADADLIVAAWGTHAHRDRVAAVPGPARSPHRAVPGPHPRPSATPPLYVAARTPLTTYRHPRHDWTGWQPICDPGVDEQLYERFCPTCGADEIGVVDHRRGERP